MIALRSAPPEIKDKPYIRNTGDKETNCNEAKGGTCHDDGRCYTLTWQSSSPPMASSNSYSSSFSMATNTFTDMLLPICFFICELETTCLNESKP